MPGGSRRGRRRRRRNVLGLATCAVIALLLGGYVAALEYQRPHVSGDRLRFDTFVRLVGGGRIKQARILDEDAYVVGTYVKAPGPLPPPPAAQIMVNGAHNMGGSPNLVISPSTTVPAGDPEGGERRPFVAPLLKANTNTSPVADLLVYAGVPTTIDQQVGKRLAEGLGLVLPALIVVTVFVYLIVSYVRGTGLFNVRSGAQRVRRGDTTATFADVAGQEHAVLELREIRDFLADPGRFRSVGAVVPKGILLYGPPGCGKTLLARAVAGEAGASFYSISGADFVELYVGVGAARVRDLFAEARANTPAIVFIDELDSVGRRRRSGGAGSTGGQEEQEQALNQILTELDGFSPLDGIIVMGATNRPDILDPALLRPGRFDRTIGLERPDEHARLAVLRVHARGKSLDPGADLAAIASRAVGLSGADLANVVNEGALLAARSGRQAVAQPDLENALDRVLQAPERHRRLSMRDREFGRATGSEERVTFADVAGMDEAIEELAEVREYLSDPERFGSLGARPPRGFLLVGPPGCGKTLLARAVAVESNATFFSVAATEFVEVFSGEGAARVRDLFAEAKAAAPSVVFLDEIDAVGARRGASADGSREREQTLNQILVELDGFGPRTGVTVIAATNRPEILDDALVRPGRFDRTIVLHVPDRAARREILAVHARGKPLADVDLDAVAAVTQGFSGADLANVVNEAALLAGRRHLATISRPLVDEAVSRVGSGVARARRLTDEDRAMVAYHEAGHALVALALPGAGAPHRVSIVARGQSLGSTWQVDAGDRLVLTRSVLTDRMAVLLGGRAAERLVFGEPGSGAADDLRRVAAIARQMVCEYAMTDALGAVAYPDATPTAAVDAEVRSLVDQALRRATAVLEERRPALDRVASALLERESLEGAELEYLVDGPAPAPADGVTEARR
ncbi:MAG TPA: AAA family ATPase [Acidimicrobiales bacterium]|nr:AAA family ATPase [Acidimicrobiales bacterium]